MISTAIAPSIEYIFIKNSDDIRQTTKAIKAATIITVFFLIAINAV